MKKKTTLPVNMDLYRARLDLGIAKDVLSGKQRAPDHVSVIEYVMFLQCSAFESVIEHLEKTKP